MKKLTISLMCLFCGTGIFGASWTVTGSTNAFRGDFNTVTFTDGRIMICGGMNTLASSTYEIFNPSTGTWSIFMFDTVLGSCTHTTGILLPNGTGLFENFNRQLFTYDPINALWTKTRWWQVPGASSSWQCATLLKSGGTLLAGHPYGRYTYVYEYPNDTLCRVGDLSGTSSNDRRSNAAEVILPNGKVMLTGGQKLDSTIRSDCEIYDEAARTWSMAASMNQPRNKHIAVLLRPPYQKVLVAGSGQAELYDPVADSWAYTGALNVEPRLIATACLLPNGKVLIMGGSDLSSCELYDPTAETWTFDASMAVGRHHFTSAILPTGKIIAIGDEGLTGDKRCEIYDPIVGSWTSQETLQTARIAPAITLLPIPNCSTNILITGGEDGNRMAFNSCELFNYKENTTALTGSMSVARTHHTMNLMPLLSGEVLVTGGRNGSGPLNSAEIYNPATGTWISVASMATARFDHTATLLKDGRILVTGGENSIGYTNTCEIWSDSGWTTTSAMATPRAMHTAVLLLDGRVMVMGGETTGRDIISTCEIYDPVSGIWSSAPNMITARSLHVSVLLQSGKVFIIGGKSSSGLALKNCETYTPDSSLWRATGSLTTARYAHNATLTYAGLVLVSGGAGDLNSCEIYDPATNAWTSTGTFGPGRGYHASVLVPYLHPYVYVIGGSSGSSPISSIDRFDFGLGYEEDWQSRILNYSAATSITPTMSISGSLFRGFSEGDGGNNCYIANTDHPIISLVRIGGGNWQGNGGGDILNMPLSSYWDTASTMVHPQIADFRGYYRLWSIVNGIPCKWYKLSPGVEENPKCLMLNAELKIIKDKIYLAVENRMEVELKLYDLCGRMREVVYTGTLTKGNYIFTPNIRINGVYFATLSAGNIKTTKKLVFIK